MKTVKDVYEKYRTALQSVYEGNEVSSITNLVLAELTGFSNAQLKAFTDTALTDAQQQLAETTLSQLQTGMPVQYILGRTEFYGLEFKVNPHVLIPRPETEELVEWIISTASAANNSKQAILDIGTGSGCIAISLKKYLPNATVSAIDISPGALQTARENAQLNEADVEFTEADILQLKPSELPDQNYTIIVSNPPYVTLTDKQQMHTNVTDFEPHTALFVPEHNPLLFYNAIADLAASNLTQGGYLFFEINESYGKETIDMLKDKQFTNIELKQDMFGKDRMIKACWQQ